MNAASNAIAMTDPKHFGCLKNAFDAIGYVKPNFTWKKRPRRGLSNEHPGRS
jgi:hypothetical protein